uniref:Uncharacterized protein n=1 Tax=Oncorhynchus kisutch TaxID=8019 RepID=A0A8C7KNT6_ONCKI
MQEHKNRTRDADPRSVFRSISATSQDKDEIVRTMKEMFCHLDPEVLYIVLAECDFKGK